MVCKENVQIQDGCRLAVFLQANVCQIGNININILVIKFNDLRAEVHILLSHVKFDFCLLYDIGVYPLNRVYIPKLL